jgi:hypothetical protein
MITASPSTLSDEGLVARVLGRGGRRRHQAASFALSANDGLNSNKHKLNKAVTDRPWQKERRLTNTLPAHFVGNHTHSQPAK